MKHITLALAAGAVLTLASCKKSSDETTNTNNGNVQTPALKLKKIVQTQNGTSRTLTFSYANDGLLSGYTSSDNVDHTSFAYDGNKNLTTIDETEANFHNIYTYTYTNNKPVTATYKSWQITAGQANQLIEDDELTYTVENDRVTKIHVKSVMTGDEHDFELTYNAEGEVTQVKTIGSDLYKATFTYGTHKSPFPQVTKWVLDQAGFSVHYYTRRDQLSAAYDFPGTQFDVTQTTTYTYNNAGYPATANSGTVQSVFEYQ